MPARKPEPPDDWAFASFAEVATRFGLSSDALAVLAAEKTFPVYSRKICPALMKEWLRSNAGRLRDMAVS